jgi:hypothetical protein
VPNRRTVHQIAPITPSTIRNATKKRTASGISAPNKLSNIRATPRIDRADRGKRSLLKVNDARDIRPAD